jgi:hypothetical protein
LDLPDEIKAGLDDIPKRTSWNQRAPAEYGLPTETWRELVARRRRYEEVRGKLANGEIRSIDDFITYNLNIRRFAQDVLETTESADLLDAFWKALTSISILDPTVGSGAFLFAALNILEPLYEAALDRMEEMLAEHERANPGKTPAGKLKGFADVLDQVDKHTNREYFILKTIILGNLYGVDIMEEAVEICKLRFFLKLASKVEPDPNAKNYGLEPLPDLDFNVRAGNTLVGYATEQQAHDAIDSDITLMGEWKRIKEDAEVAAKAFAMFREQQTRHGVTAEENRQAKSDLQKKLNKLRDQLDRVLASAYGINSPDKNPEKFEAWRKSHQPFHWFVEFYGILNCGGFDAIVGNPPFLEASQVEYSTDHLDLHDSRAVHAMCAEVCLKLKDTRTRISLVMPMSLVSTQRMEALQKAYEASCSMYYANYSWRPSKLFEGVNRAISIFVAAPKSSELSSEIRSTGYMQWYSESRDTLIQGICYSRVSRFAEAWWIPKLGHAIELDMIEKLSRTREKFGHVIAKGKGDVYYRTTGGLYWKVFTDFPPSFRVNGKSGRSSRETSFALSDPRYSKIAVAVLSSNLFWWWYAISSNLRDLNPSDINLFPCPSTVWKDETLHALGEVLLDDLKRNSIPLVREQKQTGRTETQSFKVSSSKNIIDEITVRLAKHFGFTDEECDFLNNYDVKFRVPTGEGGGDSDEE